MCRHFDFTGWLLGGQEFKRRLPRDWYLGCWKDAYQREFCPLCHLVCYTVEHNLGSDNNIGLSRALLSLRRHEFPIKALEVRLSCRDPFGWEATVQFQRHHQILFAKESEGAPSIGPLPNNARNVPAKMNFEMVKEWILECNKHEQCRRNTDVDDEQPINMKVIEVRTLHLIQAPTNCRYVVLSYTWGGVKMNMMDSVWNTKTGVLDLKTVFDKLPKTIRDATNVVQNLGERYLWIDAVCINQQSDRDKIEQIAQMDRIYSSSILTIVAAAGSNANTGLPGLQENSRIPFQLTKRVGSYILRTALPSDPRIGIIDSAPWNQRGWTYQERLLSRRCLIFTFHQIYFQCRSGIRSEDTVQMKLQVPATTKGQIAWLSPPRFDRIQKFLLLSPFAEFVHEYTTRKFSYQSDVLKASMAVLKLFSHIYQSPILWGLPERAFERALLWDYECSYRTPISAKLQRRKEFPSWSWASWPGQIVYNSDNLLHRSVVTWYKLLQNGDLCKIINNKMKNEEQDNAEGVKSMRDWSPEQYQNPGMDLKMYEAGKTPNECSTGFLVFWTTMVILSIEPTLNSLLDTKSPYIHCLVLDDKGNQITARPMVLPRSWWTAQTRHRFSFIVVTQNIERVVLFLVERQGSVIARVGQVGLYRRHWELLSGKTWGLVTLG